MINNIKKQKKVMEKLLSKKRKILKKLESKEFSKFVQLEISNKFDRLEQSIISTTLKEELEPYIEEIKSIEKQNDNLNLSLEDCFKTFSQKAKEQMIGVGSCIPNEIETFSTNENDSMEEAICTIIDRPIKRKKDKIRKDIKTIILNKIKEEQTKRKRRIRSAVKKEK